VLLLLLPPLHRPALRYFPTILIVLLAVFNDGAMIALSKVRRRTALKALLHIA
jgi:hypothetical protein